jgi:hypothetical protein
MIRHPEEHEGLLVSIAAGELAPGDQAVRHRRAECAECDKRIGAILSVVGLLDQDARDVNHILAEAARMSSAPGEDRIMALASHPEIRSDAAPPRRLAFPAWIPVATAAAAILAVFLIVRVSPTGSEESEEPRLLGERADISPITPTGASVFERFAWTVEGAIAERARSYTLVVEGADFLEEIEGLTSTEWSDPSRARGFPDSIEWLVEAYDATGALLARSARASAQRSP